MSQKLKHLLKHLLEVRQVQGQTDRYHYQEHKTLDGNLLAMSQNWKNRDHIRSATCQATESKWASKRSHPGRREVLKGGQNLASFLSENHGDGLSTDIPKQTLAYIHMLRTHFSLENIFKFFLWLQIFKQNVGAPQCLAWGTCFSIHH